MESESDYRRSDADNWRAHALQCAKDSAALARMKKAGPRATYANVTRTKHEKDAKQSAELDPVSVQSDDNSVRDAEVEKLLKLKDLDTSQKSLLMKRIESLVVENKVLRDANRRLVDQYDNTNGKVNEIDILATLDSDRAPASFPAGDVRSIHLAKHAMREEEHFKHLQMKKLQTMFEEFDGVRGPPRYPRYRAERAPEPPASMMERYPRHRAERAPEPPASMMKRYPRYRAERAPEPPASMMERLYNRSRTFVPRREPMYRR